MLFRLLRRRFKAAYDEKKRRRKSMLTHQQRVHLNPEKGVYQLQMYDISFTIFANYLLLLAGLQTVFGHSLTMYCLIKRKTRPQERERHRRVERERVWEGGREGKRELSNTAVQIEKLLLLYSSSCPFKMSNRNKTKSTRTCGQGRRQYKAPAPVFSFPLPLLHCLFN